MRSCASGAGIRRTARRSRSRRTDSRAPPSPRRSPAPTWSARAPRHRSRSSRSATSRRARTSTPSARPARGPASSQADVVAAASLFVDRRESTVNESGDYLGAVAERGIGPEHILAELGELLVGAHPGRRSDEELTVFKSLGLAAEDLAAAALCVERRPRARHRSRGGVLIPLDAIETARRVTAGTVLTHPARPSGGRGSLRDLAQARVPPADRLVQAPRRRQRDPSGSAAGVGATASGRRAPGTWLRGSAGSRAS